MKYNFLLIDSLNLLYRISQGSDTSPSLVSSKPVFKPLVIKYLEIIEDYKREFLQEGGEVYFLFDTAPLKHDAKKSFKKGGGLRHEVYAKYKEKRKYDSKPFYNSLDLIKYYYMINTSIHHCLTIPGLEADDLVKPVLETFCKNKSALMITSDSDWTRYLSSEVHWLPKLREPPESPVGFIAKHNYAPTEESVILYKTLFGDSTDGIPQLLTKSEAHLKEFYEVASTATVDSLLAESKLGKICNTAILAALREQDRQARINYQLAASIPVKEEHIKAVDCIGRNSTTLVNAIHVALGLTKAQKKAFVFGNVRVAPTNT